MDHLPPLRGTWSCFLKKNVSMRFLRCAPNIILIPLFNLLYVTFAFIVDEFSVQLRRWRWELEEHRFLRSSSASPLIAYHSSSVEGWMR